MKKNNQVARPLIDYEVTIRSEVIEDAEDIKTVRATSRGEAVKIAMENYEAQYRIYGSIEIEVEYED